jgi:integrase
MDTNGQEKQQPATTRNAQPDATRRQGWEPPRGIRLITRADRPERRFAVQWVFDGQRRTKAFALKTEQLAFAKSLAGQVKSVGITAYQLSPAEAREWRAFKAMVAPATLDEVYACFSRFGDRSRAAMLCREAGKRFLELREAMRLSRDSVSHVRLHLDRFLGTFGSKALADIAAKDVRAWLAGLTNPDTGAPMEQTTRIHHLRTVKLFLKTAVAEKWTNDNPASAIVLPKDDADDVTVLSLEDARLLFSKNRDALCIGRLALEAFGGLRFTSAARLRREDIDRAERGIVMPGKVHKSGRRHYVDGYPDNLWAWIQHAPDACWDIHPRQYLDLKAAAFKRAGVKNPGNVLRHSFCSYHIAVHKDAARTAILLTHRGANMLFQHYRGNATHADGEAYFNIMP